MRLKIQTGRGPVMLASASLLLFCIALFHPQGDGILVAAKKDNGVVKSGSSLHCEILVTNFLPRSVEISTEFGCRCTVVELTKERLAFLRSTKAEAEIDTTGMKPGVHQKSVFLYFISGKVIWSRTIDIRFKVV